MNDITIETSEDGTVVYYLGDRRDNIFHREDGPAIKALNGDEAWYYEGTKHRDGGPLLKRTGGVSTGSAMVSCIGRMDLLLSEQTVTFNTGITDNCIVRMVPRLCVLTVIGNGFYSESELLRLSFMNTEMPNRIQKNRTQNTKK